MATRVRTNLYVWPHGGRERWSAWAHFAEPGKECECVGYGEEHRRDLATAAVERFRSGHAVRA
jgi:hypothetical protein